ncbi:MAG: hypothetical protein PHH16_04290 [Candidatus Gracilibacteria bacterium]|nr:hypothetical protein [Candidatus Gracilibacteria bacterium]
MRKNSFFGTILALVTLSTSLSSCSTASSNQANGFNGGPSVQKNSSQASLVSQKAKRNINTVTKAS